MEKPEGVGEHVVRLMEEEVERATKRILQEQRASFRAEGARDMIRTLVDAELLHPGVADFFRRWGEEGGTMPISVDGIEIWPPREW